MPSGGAQALGEQTEDISTGSRRLNGGPKRGNRGGQNRDVQVSKALSKLLRHDAEKVGLRLDEEGFADVEEVVSS